MSEPLFVYGTLRDPDLLAGVLARPLRGEAMLGATAPGYRAVHYPGRVYPGLVRAPGAAAEGLVLTDLTPFERDLLDAYEGEEYRRGRIAVMIAEELHEAFAYLPGIAISAVAAEWTLSTWQMTHKGRALKAECLAADALRARMIAIRPH